MIGEKKERWKLLCEQATVEQDSQRLAELVREINNLLEEKFKRLQSKTPFEQTGHESE